MCKSCCKTKDLKPDAQSTQANHVVLTETAYYFARNQKFTDLIVHLMVRLCSHILPYQSGDL